MKELAVASLYCNVIFSDERHFQEALTRWNYFPNQKASVSELPPCISTRRFTPEIAEKLFATGKLSNARKKLGFDLVEYRATRYNNVSRVLGLIHPLAYAHIYCTLQQHRVDLTAAMNDANSAVCVNTHTDGRMLIMNYEDQESRTLKALEQSFGKKYRAHADISNCFSSIYTHSLEWATQGFDEAKANLIKKERVNHWSSDIDRVLRGSKRNETSGLPVGPASSSIAVEVILAAVDKELRGHFSFVRYVDDYTALCTSYDEAQEFIRRLGNELARYRLTLNIAKTSIVKLPEPTQDKWVTELMNMAPSLLRENGQPTPLRTSDAIQFLDHAVRLNNETPDGSILKFAVASISNRLQGRSAADVFQYVLNLAWHYPILLPYLEKIDARSDYYDKDKIVGKLNEIIDINTLHRRSDGVSWALYYLERLDASPQNQAIAEIIASRDCVPIALLSKFKVAEDQLVEYAKALAEEHPYEKDKNWLFLYQLYRAGKIDNPYGDESTFELLKKYDVDFLSAQGEASRAEDYCFHIQNPFIEPHQIQTFDQWMEAGAAAPQA